MSRFLTRSIVFILTTIVIVTNSSITIMAENFLENYTRSLGQSNNKIITNSIYNEISYFKRGAALSIYDFERAFVGDQNYRVWSEYHINTYIKISNISILNNEIEINLKYFTESSYNTISILGNLYRGARSENHIILIPQYINEGYDLLLFEIQNEYSFSNLFLPSSYNLHYYLNYEQTMWYYIPHVRIYFIDSNDLVHLFEFEVPEIFKNFSAENLPQDFNNDLSFTWFLPLIGNERPRKHMITSKEYREYSVFSNHYYSDNNVIQLYNIHDSSSGFASSIDDFNRAFTGDINYRVQPRIYIPTEIKIENVSIHGNEISMNLNLRTGLIYDEIVVQGTLYKGSRSYNSIVFNPSYITKGYELLLFEIHNSYDFVSLMLSEPEEYTPRVMIYLISPYNLIHLFEFEIPDKLKNFSAENLPYAEGIPYILWFQDLVEWEIRSEPIDFEVMRKYGLYTPYETFSPFGMNTFSLYWGPRQYTATVNVGAGSETFSIFSVPRFRYIFTNVTGNNSSWSLEFNISEITTILNSWTGAIISQHRGQRFFVYRDVQLFMSVGANTRIVQTFRQGRVINFGGSLTSAGNVVLGVMRTVVFSPLSSLPGGSILQSLAQNITTAVQNREDHIVLLGTFHTHTASGLLVASGYSIPVGNSMHLYRDAPNGHYFLLHSIVSRYGNIPGSILTQARFEVRYSVYTNSGTAPVHSFNHGENIRSFGTNITYMVSN